MVRLTHNLIRKKSEHNEGTMSDLEEISLHQLEIEKIENLDCKKLKILVRFFFFSIVSRFFLRSRRNSIFKTISSEKWKD